MYSDLNKTLKLYNTKDLAKLLHVSKETIYRLVESRKISFYKIKGSIRFAEKDVLKYLEENKFKSGF